MENSPFQQVIGHGPLCAYFSRILDEKQHAHAYLLAGPEHVGKTLLATTFLAELLGIPAHQLEQSGVYREVNPEKSIKIDEMRGLKEHFSHSAFIGTKKAALIVDAHRMTIAAQNALLKTLEEPAGDSVLFLTTSQPEQLLETIHSRCHVLTIALTPREEICTALKKEFDQDLAHFIAHLSGGRPGLAIRLSDAETRERYLEHRAKAQEILSAEPAERFMKCSALGRSGDRDAVTQQLLFLLHDLALVSQGNTHQIMNTDLEDFMIQLDQNKQGVNWSEALAQWLVVQESIRCNVSPALALESLSLSM